MSPSSRNNELTKPSDMTEIEGSLGSTTIAALLHPFSYPERRLSDGPLDRPRPFLLAAATPKEANSVERHDLVSFPIAGRDTRSDGASESHFCPSLASLSFADTEESESSTPCTTASFTSDGDKEVEDELSTSAASPDDFTPLVDLPIDATEADHETLPPAIVCKEIIDPEFQNGHFVVARSHIAGWGAFAARDLKLGDVILNEEPILTAVCDRALLRKFSRLNQAAKAVALSLYSNEQLKQELPLIKRVWLTNCFAMDCYTDGLFPIAARFNHACSPLQNVAFAYNREKECLTLTVRAERITKGEELTISYGIGRTPAELYVWYGFRCHCGACSGLSDKEVARLSGQW